jgi:hypothetical protein
MAEGLLLAVSSPQTIESLKRSEPAASDPKQWDGHSKAAALHGYTVDHIYG